MLRLIIIFLCTAQATLSQQVIIFPYTTNPGLFFEELQPANLLDQDVKITTIIDIVEVTTIIKKIANEAAYIWNGVKESYQTFTRDFKRTFKFLAKNAAIQSLLNQNDMDDTLMQAFHAVKTINPTEGYNVTKRIQKLIKTNETIRYFFNPSYRLFYIKNDFEIVLPYLLEENFDLNLNDSASLKFGRYFDLLYQLKYVLSIGKTRKIPDLL